MKKRGSPYESKGALLYMACDNVLRPVELPRLQHPNVKSGCVTCVPYDEIQQQKDQTENMDKIIRQAKKYLRLEKLTPAVLNDLFKAVYVHAPDKSSGYRVQKAEISYNYIGILPATLLYDLQNGKTA